MAQSYAFGPWMIDEASGNTGFTPVILAEAEPAIEAGVVVFRIAMIADPAHLALFREGKVKPAILQLSMPADRARKFASQLELAADQIEGRVPATKN